MSKKCSANNKNGNRCGAWSVKVGAKCALHSDPERAAKMGAKHGRKASLQPLPDETPMEPPKTAGDVRDALAKTMAKVDARSIDTRTANTLAYVAAGLLRAIEVADLETQLKELRSVVDSQREPGK
jgi:hypothetical protein